MNKYSCTEQLEQQTNIILDFYSNFPNIRASASSQLGLHNTDIQKGWIPHKLLEKSDNVEKYQINNVVTNGFELDTDERKENVKKLYYKSQMINKIITHNIKEFIFENNGKVRQSEISKTLGFRDYDKDDRIIARYIDNAIEQDLLVKEKVGNCAFIKNSQSAEWNIQEYDSSLSLFSHKSNGEAAAAILFTQFELNWINEKTFPGCVYKKPLRFDFYLPDYNILVEIDGIQHYESVQYFGGQKQFEMIKKRDEIKTQFAIENDFTLWRVKYTDKKSLVSDLNYRLTSLFKDNIN